MDAWDKKQKILVVLAHPDDPEFFCGATIAMWIKEGHEVSYCLLTKGQKGSQDPLKTSREIELIREDEQKRAASVLGVHSVEFLWFEDGCLEVNQETRCAVVRVIRRERPDILVTCDPTNFFPNDSYINHPDHRMAGQIALEAVFPAAGNPRFFPELLDEGLLPHNVKEVWLSLTHQPNTTLDVTAMWDQKVRALLKHQSQIGDPIEFNHRMRVMRKVPQSPPDAPRYEEKFRRFIFP